MSHTLDLKRLNEVFDCINDNTERLNNWERNFVANIYDQWGRGVVLSDATLVKLEEIYVQC